GEFESLLHVVLFWLGSHVGCRTGTVHDDRAIRRRALDLTGILISPEVGQAQSIGANVHAVIAIIVKAIGLSTSGRPGIAHRMETAKIFEPGSHVEAGPVTQSDVVQRTVLISVAVEQGGLVVSSVAGGRDDQHR